MTPEIFTLLAILAVALVLFSTEWVTVDVSALILVLAMFFTGLVDLPTVSAGFGNEVLLFLGSLLVVTEGLVRTGALVELERLLRRLAARKPRFLELGLLAGAGLLSAFLSNTATVAALLPLVLGFARGRKQAPSQLLMPLAFAGILGGTCTLIGTSTNIVVSGALTRYGLEPFTFLELTPVGLPLLLLGLVYLTTAGKRLLPDYPDETLERYGVRDFLAEVEVAPGSPWADKTLAEARVGQELDLLVLGRLGEGGELAPVAAESTLEEGDRLLVQAPPEGVARLLQRSGLTLPADRGPVPGVGPLRLHEVLVAPGSRLSGSSLASQRFRTRYGLSVLAIHRRGAPRLWGLRDLPLRDGDVLLVQGDLAQLEWLVRSGDLIPLEEHELPRRDRRLWWAVGLFGTMIVVGAAGWLPLALAALTAAVLLVLTGCLSSVEAYRAIDWTILVLVGGLLTLAAAMESSGTAAYLTERIVALAEPWGPISLLAGFFLITVALTQPMSNQAAALVVLPLAVGTAQELGFDPRAFAVTVALAASCSFLTPLEPASLLVFGPGRYRFRDFFVVGLPLTLLTLLVTLLLVPRIWPL